MLIIKEGEGCDVVQDMSHSRSDQIGSDQIGSDQIRAVTWSIVLNALTADLISSSVVTVEDNKEGVVRNGCNVIGSEREQKD